MGRYAKYMLIAMLIQACLACEHMHRSISAAVQESFLPAWRQMTLGVCANGLAMAAESLAFGLQVTGHA